MSFFIAKDVSAGYGRQAVVEDISFQLERGEILGIIGANGSGKTTLLKAICGILPHGGECRLDSVVLESLKPGALARLVSYIPQRSGITIDISASDVVLMGFNSRLGLLQQPNEKMKREAAEALCAVGLSGMEEKNYLHLSEGQKQLCILARTLVSGCSLMLLDEPESALDFNYRHSMLMLLRSRAEKGGGSALVSLHDPQLALNYCHRLLLLSEGRAIAVIDPLSDPIEETERLLSRIYGPVSLQICGGKRGKKHIVMLKEEGYESCNENNTF